MKRVIYEYRELPSTWADAFVPDGGLRDIYVHDVAAAEWQAALDHVRRSYGALGFYLDGRAAPLPPTAADALASRPAASPMLSIPLGAVTLNCHFFAATEIEFDLDPEDVQGEAGRATVVSFMRGLAVAVGRPVELTMENMPEHIFLRVEPTGPGDEPRIIAPAG
jgi:hypothetical protein